MKRKIDIFWYWFLIIVAFVICFMFSSVKANAATIGGEIPGDVNDPGTSEETNLYEQCHTYITTNIISAESLTEALNGKIYGNFTQEDCMEMINIASKREVIKNLVNLQDRSTILYEGINYGYFNQVLILNGTSTGSPQLGQTLNPIELNGDYTFTVIFEGSFVSGGDRLFLTLVNESGQQILYCQPNVTQTKCSQTKTNLNTTITQLRIWAHSGDVFNDFKIKIQLEKGSTATPYVSYDYHREYYEEGIDYADNRVNTNSTSYTQGVTDADNRVNTNSTNYKKGVSDGYEKANKEGKLLGNFIPSLLGGFGSFFLTLLNIDILGFNLLSVIGILITVLGIVVVIKFLKG